jgi:alkanesulfonate monooxygenase SsuD/methylene tetrahydromethanopterin reductase-like flavin-dependent oxidoreductase (luciferase family)
MQIGVDSFVAAPVDGVSGRAVDPARHLSELLEAFTLADEVGLDVFGIGEHHRREFLDSAPAVILAAAAVRTRRIRLTSAVTVLSAADPVRVFQEFATLDLLSNGRAEIVVGRGSFIEAFPLFGFELDDYDSLFAEKLDLLLHIRENVHAKFLYSCRYTRAAADGSDHWRRTAPVSAIDRSLPPGRGASWPFSGSIQGGDPFAGLRC